MESLGNPGQEFCINVHKKAKKKWTNLQHELNYRRDIPFNVKKSFYFQYLHFQNNRIQNNGVIKGLGILQSL